MYVCVYVCVCVCVCVGADQSEFKGKKESNIVGVAINILMSHSVALGEASSRWVDHTDSKSAVENSPQKRFAKNCRAQSVFPFLFRVKGSVFTSF